MATTTDRFVTWPSDAYNRLIAGLIDGLQRDGLLATVPVAGFAGLCSRLSGLPKPATFNASSLDASGRQGQPQEMCVDTDEVRALFREYRELVTTQGVG